MQTASPLPADTNIPEIGVEILLHAAWGGLFPVTLDVKYWTVMTLIQNNNIVWNMLTAVYYDHCIDLDQS